jgi:hypothetical protein
MFLLLHFRIITCQKPVVLVKDHYFDLYVNRAIEQDADIVSFLYRQNIIKLTNGMMMKLRQQQRTSRNHD